MPHATDHSKSRPVHVREGFHLGTRVYFIPLTKGHEAAVEPADWHRIAAQYGTRWTAAIACGYVYARKAVTFADGTIRLASLARVIMDARPDERVRTGNGNPLDMRRSNLSKHRFGGKVAKHRRQQHRERQTSNVVEALAPA